MSEKQETCRLIGFQDTEIEYVGGQYDSVTHDHVTIAECSKCGAVNLVPPNYGEYYGETQQAMFDTTSMFALPNYCMNCGEKVTYK